MRSFITLALVMLSVLVGLQSLALGIAGLLGSLADVSHAENVAYGLPFLAIATVVLGPTIGWVWWLRAKYGQRTTHHRRL